jgi:hypothetical protein
MVKSKIGVCWFVHYSFVVGGAVNEDSTYLTDLSGCGYFRYKYTAGYIEKCLNNRGLSGVVIRNFQKVPIKAGEEYWADQPHESWMVTDLIK